MRLLCVLLIIVNLLFGKIDKSQIELLNTIYNEAKRYKAINGHVFNDTICAIYLVESSAGKNVIGDNVDLKTGKMLTLFESSIGPGQIRLETALFVMNKFPQYFNDISYLIHPDISAYKTYVKYLKNIDRFKSILKRYRSYLSKTNVKKKIKHYKAVIRWAYKELQYNKKKLEKYKYIIYKDKQIINLLFSDIRFSAKISTLYLIYNYNYAIKNRMSNPWFRTVSRYNGGWNNKKYYKKVVKKMKLIRYLKRKKLIQ